MWIEPIIPNQSLKKQATTGRETLRSAAAATSRSRE
jgi:hypothetical protein